ncbi:MAG: UDP-N-acetylglucosamine--LPS N-acetylglucosamine transferase [Phycisphaerales bacterium]
MTATARKRRILAISSGGGHWVQLNRLRPAFDGHDVAWVSVNPAYRADVESGRYFVVPDATRWDRVRLVLMILKVMWLLVRIRPHVIVSTGAAPGYIALRLGALLGAKTVWLDSIANVERLSMSGEKIGPHADLWLTQWKHLAREGGPAWRGSVL